MCARKGQAMLLSEAIREGATHRPKGRGAFFGTGVFGMGDDEVLCSCAMGAAYEAVTGYASQGESNFPPVVPVLEAHFPLDADVLCPVEGSSKTVMQAVTYLNDRAGWTR